MEEGKILAEGRLEASARGGHAERVGGGGAKLHGETVPLDAAASGKGKFGFTLRVPCGIVVAITPFNFPLNLVATRSGRPWRAATPSS